MHTGSSKSYRAFSQIHLNFAKVRRWVCIFSPIILFGCGGHEVIGGDTYYKGSGSVEVLADFMVDGLQIRNVLYRDSEFCNAGGALNTIELNGKINNDAVFVVEKILRSQNSSTHCKQTGRLTTKGGIYMNSLGGSLESGILLGQLIRRHGWMTVVAYGQTCASACALAFLGGTYRQVFPSTATLVFHAPYRLVGSSLWVRPDCSNRDANQTVRDYYKKMIGPEDGNTLYERTMQYCSQNDGWEVNRDAAKLFGIDNL